MPTHTVHPLLAICLVVVALAAPARAADGPLRVCATIPDIGALAQEVGGEDVSVTVFVKGPEDAHFIEARPSFVRALADADLFIQSGLELEVGWAPVLLKNARNERVLPGAPGFLEASSVIYPMDIPSGVVDRSLGDVHAAGNPHFFTDPVSGLKVAKLIADKLSELRPASAVAIGARYKDFTKRLGVRLFGAALADKYDPAKLALLLEHDKLNAFLMAQGDAAQLGGWLAQARAAAGRKVVSDHTIWPYFARTFGFEVVGYLEPKPGIPPTTRHLQEVIALMKSGGVTVILTSPFFDPKYARLVAAQTGAQIAAMAHQVGSLAGTDDYLTMIDHNVTALTNAFAGAK